ncbi:isoprenoid synthase domain-containing protein [Aspergillus ambiguus]|uniref:uncharacterized protein n=1 Tax=Aspergillus ambiguus TaxID=176160 RepID=UPI003CCD5CDC
MGGAVFRPYGVLFSQPPRMLATIGRGLLVRSRRIRQQNAFACVSLRTLYKDNKIQSTSGTYDDSIPKHDFKPRQVFYAFDPAISSINTPPLGNFSFLLPTNVPAIPEFQHVHAIPPDALGVPWPTSFPTTLESKYWREAEHAAKDFLQFTLANQPDRANDCRFIDGIADAAVSFAVHVAPMGDVARMKVLAKAYVLLFMHDDAIETGNYAAAIPTAGQVLSQDSPSLATQYRGYHLLSEEVLFEDPTLGQYLLDGMLSWGSLDVKTYPDTFSSLGDYLVHRVEDVGAYPIFRTAEFACGLQLSEQKNDTADSLRALCARHLLLTNDLYSYAKEARAEEQDGAKLFNAVCVVQQLTGVSAPCATGIVRHILWDIERQISGEYGQLVRESSPSESVRARVLIAAVSGNMYFSATSARYARTIDGAKLAR